MSQPGPSAPRVFLYGYYGCGNLGDDLLLIATIEGILAHWPKATFQIRNMGPTAAIGRFGDRAQLTGLDQILQTPGQGKARRFSRYFCKASHILAQSDIFVMGGGTLLHAKTSIVPLLPVLGLLLIANRHRVRCAAVGIGTAGLDRPAPRRLVPLIRTLMVDIAARDEPSAVSLGGRPKVRSTADLVYGWWPAGLTHVTPAQRPVIAVSLVVPGPKIDGCEALATALAKQAQAGAVLRFLVFQDGHPSMGGLSDRTQIDPVRTALAARGVASEIVTPAPDPKSLADAFAGVVVHCGARFHANVVASLLHIPFVGLAGDPKVLDLARVFKMPSLNVEGFNAAELGEAIAKARERAIDDAILQTLRAKSAGNFAWFAQHASR